MVDIASLLGCSRPYVETMGRYLGTGVTPYVSVGQVEWSPTPDTRSALAARERTILISEERDLLRDGLFGFWLSHGDVRFKIIDNPAQEIPASRLLGTVKTPGVDTLELRDVCRSALSTFDSEVEIHSYEQPKSAGIGWVELRLLVFQSGDRKAGRILLLNPELEDHPLDELSFQFEQLLKEGTVPLYFTDDPLGTASTFWTALRAPLVGLAIRDDLAVVENELQETRQELDAVKTEKERAQQSAAYTTRFEQQLDLARNTATGEALIAVLDALTELLKGLSAKASLEINTSEPQQIVEKLKAARAIAVDQGARLSQITQTLELSIDSPDISDSDRKLTADRLIALLRLMASELHFTGVVSEPTAQNDEVIERYEEAIAKRDAERQRLLSRIAEMPSTEVIESREHPRLLMEALDDSQQSLIVISPWIKMRVLRPLLPAIDRLLARGCEMWIGYGMPKSRHHQDTSDVEAIAALRERQQTGKLFLVELTTHEKVLIVDDRVFVNSSFNWLSYTGTDGRRETGTVLKGRLSHLRDRFLADMQKKLVKAQAVTSGAN